MTKAVYLDQLDYKLRALPYSERKDALEYYDGYLSDAEDEAAAIAQLGSPAEVAATIIADRAAKEPAPSEASATPKERASGVKTAWLVILAIFALPIGLPLVIALASVAFALFVSLLAVVVAVGATALGLLAAGVASVVAFPWIASQDAGLALMLAGAGLMLVGIGILLVKFVSVLMKGFPMIARFVGKKIASWRKNRKGRAQ